MTVVDPWRAGCFELVVVFWSRRFLLFHTWPQVLVGQHPVLPDNWHYLCYETFPSTEDSLINFAGLLIHTQVRKKKNPSLLQPLWQGWFVHGGQFPLVCGPVERVLVVAAPTEGRAPVRVFLDPPPILSHIRRDWRWQESSLGQERA